MNRKTVTNVYASVLEEAGNDFPDLVVIDADLARATQTELFQKKFPKRYLDIGIAEQNLAGVAAGIALSGRPVIISTFAVFLAQRALDQVSVSIALNKTNVKIIGIEAGLSSGRNGATHQAVEDLAIMRAMPNMTVMEPLDAVEIKEAVYAALKYHGPVYMRMRRGEVPVFFQGPYTFRWGKGVKIEDGKDVTLVSFGTMTETAVEAAALLRQEGIEPEIIHLHTLKPLDEECIIKSAAKTKAVVTLENHSVLGGVGGAVAEVLSTRLPTKMGMVGIRDSFGECGSRDYLDTKYGLSVLHVVETAKNILQEKR
jgi:transketolase